MKIVAWDQSVYEKEQKQEKGGRAKILMGTGRPTHLQYSLEEMLTKVETEHFCKCVSKGDSETASEDSC